MHCNFFSCCHRWCGQNATRISDDSGAFCSMIAQKVSDGMKFSNVGFLERWDTSLMSPDMSTSTFTSSFTSSNCAFNMPWLSTRSRWISRLCWLTRNTKTGCLVAKQCLVAPPCHNRTTVCRLWRILQDAAHCACCQVLHVFVCRWELSECRLRWMSHLAYSPTERTWRFCSKHGIADATFQ